MSGSRRKKPKPWKPKLPFARLRARSKRLELRPFLPSDFQEWLAVYARLKPRQNEFDMKPRPKAKRTRAHFLEMLGRHRKSVKRGVYIFGIFERASGELVGVIDLFIFDKAHLAANLGYQVYNHRWGEGFAPEASRLALDLSFGPLALKRVEASFEPHNKASARVPVKAGMFEEGFRRKYPIPGGMKDLLVYGMNSVDWKSRRRRAAEQRRKGKRK